MYMYGNAVSEPLDGYLQDLVGTKFSWSTQVFMLFGQIRQGVVPGQDKNMSMRALSPKYIFRMETSHRKHSTWEEVLLFLVQFRSQSFDTA